MAQVNVTATPNPIPAHSEAAQMGCPEGTFFQNWKFLKFKIWNLKNKIWNFKNPQYFYEILFRIIQIVHIFMCFSIF